MGRTSIILGALALALLAFILFFERGSVTTGEREGRKGRVLEAFVRERVDRLEIQRKGVTTVLVRKELAKNDDTLAGLENAGFHVEKPYAAKADRDAVDSLLGSLEWITPRRSLGEASAQDLARFGLDKPRYRVTFEAGRERRSFSIGFPSSDGSGAYMYTPDDKRAYVVGKDLVEALDHEPEYFHTKELHSGVNSYSTERLKVGDAQVQKSGELFWLQGPEPVLASEPAVMEIANALDALKATRFVAAQPATPASYGLDRPRFRLGLDSKVYDSKDKSHTERIELAVGSACAGHAGESYLQTNNGALMCASDADLAKLQKPATDLREKRLLVLEDSDIRSCQLQAGKLQLNVEEKDDGQRYRLSSDGHETSTGAADAGALSDWWKTLRGSNAEAFENDPTVALGTPQLVATFARGKDKPAYVIQIGRVLGERVAVLRDGEKVVAWYSKRVLDALRVSTARFRNTKLLDEDPSAFTKLTVRAAGKPAEVVSKNGDRYVLESPHAPAERPSVDEIARLIAKLEAVRFVADAALPEHQLSAPAYVIQLDSAGKSHSLRIGANADDGRYAQLDADPAVFVVAPALIRQLDAPLVSRAALAVPLEEQASVEIVAGSNKLRVEPGDERARALATLRAARALSFGKPQPAEGMDKPQLRAMVQLKGDASGTRTLLIGSAVSAEPDAELYARRTDLDVAFSVPRSVLDALRPR